MDVAVYTLTTFAETTTQDATLLQALGIEWQLLTVQIIAFLVLVAILGKFVYPWLIRQVDERQANIEKAAQAATQAQKAAAQSQEDVAEILDTARREAAEIVETAKLESAEVMKAAETKAQKTAQRITDDAQAQIQKDIAAAQKKLRAETLELVALATERLIGKTLTKEIENKRIEETLKEVS